MRSQLKDPVLREKVWPDYTFGCKRILFSSQFLPALERPNVELETGRIEAIVPEGVRTARWARARARLPDLGNGLPHQRLHVPDGDHRPRRALARRGLERRRARTPRHLRAVVPEHVRDVRAEHEHLGRLDRLLPGDPGGLPASGDRAARGPRRGRDRRARRTSSPPSTTPSSTASPARRGRSATPGTATSRDGSSPTGPATCASTREQTARLDAAAVRLRAAARAGGGGVMAGRDGRCTTT